jgi:hypothetical protein
MSDKYPSQVIRLLELAEPGIEAANVPSELANALTVCTKSNDPNNLLVRTQRPERISCTPGKVQTKRAQDLQLRDVIRVRPFDVDSTVGPADWPYGFAILGISRRNRQKEVEVVGNAGPLELLAENKVHVYVELPQLIMSEPKLLLTAEGEKVLAWHRLESEQPAAKKRMSQRIGKNEKILEPSKDAFTVYRYHVLTGKKQMVLATDPNLMELLSKKVVQGTISRWLTQVKQWLEAGNVLPNLPEHHPATKPSPMDPQRIDLGERQDGRTKRQKQRRTSGDDN